MADSFVFDGGCWGGFNVGELYHPMTMKTMLQLDTNFHHNSMDGVNWKTLFTDITRSFVEREDLLSEILAKI